MPILFTHLSPRMCLNLRKFEFSVVWVHFSNLLPRWCSQDLDKKKKNYYQLWSHIYVFSLMFYNILVVLKKGILKLNKVIRLCGSISCIPDYRCHAVLNHTLLWQQRKMWIIKNLFKNIYVTSHIISEHWY